MVIHCIVFSQTDSVLSRVYKWNNLNAEVTNDFVKRQFFSGQTIDEKELSVYALTIEPGKLLNEKSDDELLLVIKEGVVKVSLTNEIKILGPGSTVLVMSGDEYVIENTGAGAATYYVFEYESKYPVNIERGAEAGGSMIIKWDELEFQPHDKGGIRKYFERPTSMTKRLEIHVTTLNPGIKSHEPHTHRSAEFVLMINGNTEMEIGDQFYEGTDGDLYFVNSNVPHAIKNIGSDSSMYFAIQWE